MLESIEIQKRIGRLAWVMAWVGLVLGQLHALARFATAEGREDLELPMTAAWALPAADVLGPFLGWADADLVYYHYGKIWFPVFLAFTLCAFVAYRRRRPAQFEKWAWRLALTGYVVACAGVFLDYWTQWSAEANVLFAVGWIVTVPGFILTLLGSTVLGATLLIRRYRPALPAVLLVAIIPLAIGILQVTSMGSAALPVMFAFGILGRRIARTEAATAPVAVLA